MKKMTITTLILTLCLSVNAFAAPKKKAKTGGTPASMESAPVKVDAKPVRKMPQSQGAFERQYGTAGCGLGSLVMGPRGIQIFAATTNGTSYNQTFAMSTGTLNCIDSATEKTASRVDKFVEVNKVALASDMARGQGDTLEGLSTLLGCSKSGEFSKVMQSNFHAIYTSETVRTMEVTDKLLDTLLNDESLKSNCSALVTKN